jgi:nicotinate phosphoribosyltransferase
LLGRGARIDGFGVGTALATSKDAPALGGVYKLVDIESNGVPSYRAKFSEEKITYPGRKQVFRFSDSDGTFRSDTIASAGEQFPSGAPLLDCVMRNGRRAAPSPSLPSVRQYAREQLERLPPECRLLREHPAYPVSFSQQLQALLADVRKQVQPEYSGSRLRRP